MSLCVCVCICVCVCVSKQSPSCQNRFGHSWHLQAGWIQEQPVRLHFLWPMWKDQVFPLIFLSFLSYTEQQSRLSIKEVGSQVIASCAEGPQEKMQYSTWGVMGAEMHPLDSHFISNWLCSVNIQVVTCKDLYCLDYRFCQQPRVMCNQVACLHCPKDSRTYTGLSWKRRYISGTSRFVRFFYIPEDESPFFTLYILNFLPVPCRQWGYVLEWREDTQLQWIRLRFSLPCLEFIPESLSYGLSIIYLDLYQLQGFGDIFSSNSSLSYSNILYFTICSVLPLFSSCA